MLTIVLPIQQLQLLFILIKQIRKATRLFLIYPLEHGLDLVPILPLLIINFQQWEMLLTFLLIRELGQAMRLICNLVYRLRLTAMICTLPVALAMIMEDTLLIILLPILTQLLFHVLNKLINPINGPLQEIRVGKVIFHTSSNYYGKRTPKQCSDDSDSFYNISIHAVAVG